MTSQLPLLSAAEISRSIPAGDEAGLGNLTTAQGRLPLQALEVQGEIAGLLARVTVWQTFVNSGSEPLEATYIFPLPDRAAVTGFQMKVSQRTVHGELRERGRARLDYAQAIQQGKRAALAEEERAGVFTLRVGNILPGEQARVQLTLVSPLTYGEGTATFRFPLVIAPRYIPGTALSGPAVGAGTALDTDAVPDASRISPPVLLPGFPNPVQLSLMVDVLPSDLPLGDFCCSLHSVLEARNDGGVRRIILQPGERLNRDFLLRFRVGAAAVRTALTLTPDADGKEGTFALTLVPPLSLPDAARPRDVIFVLDRSLSMQGWKMLAARRAVMDMVETLTEQDRFNVYAFDERVEMPPQFGGGTLVPATDRNRFSAVEFLRTIDARAGTALLRPLDLAVHALGGDDFERARLPEAERGTHRPSLLWGGVDVGLPSGPGSESREPSPPLRPRSGEGAQNHSPSPLRGEVGEGLPECARILVLITDGQVGNEDQILQRLGSRLYHPRILALGIDQAVNGAFLQRLADLSGGTCQLVESETRLEEMLAQVHHQLGPPLLTRLQFQAAGLELLPDTLVPARLPDLFPGTPLCILGRYRGVAEGKIVVQGRDAEDQLWSEIVPARVQPGSPTTSIWARAFVRQLEDRFLLSWRDRSALEKRITEVALRFGVLCRFTGFVAVDQERVIQPGSELQQIVQPVETPAGWAGPAAVAVTAPPPPPASPPALRPLAAEVAKELRAGPDMVTMGRLPQTPRLKKALELATEEADNLGHLEVDAEHLLLGLLREEDALAGKTLRRLGLTLEAARREIQAQRPREDDVPTPGSAGMYARFTERARKVMQLANQEAQRLNHEYLGTEHLLLALICLGSGLVATLLEKVSEVAAEAATASSRAAAPGEVQSV